MFNQTKFAWYLFQEIGNIFEDQNFFFWEIYFWKNLIFFSQNDLFFSECFDQMKNLFPNLLIFLHHMFSKNKQKIMEKNWENLK